MSLCTFWIVSLCIRKDGGFETVWQTIFIYQVDDTIVEGTSDPGPQNSFEVVNTIIVFIVVTEVSLRIFFHRFTYL